MPSGSPQAAEPRELKIEISEPGSISPLPR